MPHTPAHPGATTPACTEAFKASNVAVIARQAIVDVNRAVFGYELFDRSTTAVAKNWCSSTARAKACAAAT